MHVKLIDYTPDAEDAIGHAAAICYDAKTDRDSNVRRAAHCKDRGHLATLRFAYATAHIDGISRVCSHQLVRIAHAGILQQSQRYVEQSNIEFVVPGSVADLPEAVSRRWALLLSQSRDVYAEAIAAGMKKEDARYILPQSCTTSLNLCLNFQAWRDVLKNRTDKAAQWEIRELFTEIGAKLAQIAPNIFEEYVR